MVPAPPSLPTRFPCWCRAIYSWGGESKRDLGFIEGDLIECLNAGDGSWWMGRLRRDKRMMGLFPSNFVQVLDDSFKPASRASSPMPDRSRSPNPFNPPPPKESKPKPYRKPFQSYIAPPNRATPKQAQIPKQESLPRSRGPSPAPIGIHDRIPRVPSPEQINGYGSRAPSPAPSFGYSYSRPASASPYHADIGSSPPPPPPPPHRQAPASRDSISLHDQPVHGYHTPRTPSPTPPSPGANGLTPSPLRTAMEDVMSSLQDMGLGHETEYSEPLPDVWSPEAFDQGYTKSSRNRGPPRPNTSAGIVGTERVYEHSEQYHGREHSVHSEDQQPPQLSNYVERMESRLRHMQQKHLTAPSESSVAYDIDPPPPVPAKMNGYQSRQPSSLSGSVQDQHKLRHRKSAFEVGRQMLGRTFTTKSSATSSSSGVQSTTTNGSSSTQLTDRSIMSGHSAGGFSATSAGSLARKKEVSHGRAQSALGIYGNEFLSDAGSQISFKSGRPQTPVSGITFHSSHASQPRSQSQAGWHTNVTDSGSMLGGFTTPRSKKPGLFKKIFESAMTGAASVRSNISSGDSSRLSATGSMMPNGVTAVGGGFGDDHGKNAAALMGLGGPGVDWVQVRRDINRSNTLSRIERVERKERCQMMDYVAISPVDELHQSAEGDEGADGMPVAVPSNFQTVNLGLVDKNSRFINSLPPMTNPVSLATGYVCRPYRSDAQRLRAIFTWVSEKIAWEEDFDGEVDARRVIQSKRGCAEEVAVLVMEMCAAVGIHAEVVRGYLKSPGEIPETGGMPRSNHWWNAVLVDNEWRIMDCSLASPTNPRRQLYSSTGPSVAESWYYLARPMEICYTHIPEYHQHQHIVPLVAQDVLLALPCACPPFFKNQLEMQEYDTSLLRIEDLEIVHIKISVPADVECVAEVEARAFTRDADGDLLESGEISKKRALAQAEWVGGMKRYTIKALLPGDEGRGVVKIYAGKRGLMHSIKDIPHPLALALPIIHTGDNPPYEFLTRHPTPHAQRHDLYVVQPQCQRLAINNTFVFVIRQHPSSISFNSHNPRSNSPIPITRPSSAMSMTASSASGSNPSTGNPQYTIKKPAKLAIQAPGGKILRLMRKEERANSATEGSDGGTWETIIKCGERGVWRALVLADRSARWCVFAEWTCV